MKVGMIVEAPRFGQGIILSIEGSNAKVDFNGEVKTMITMFLKAPKTPKVKYYMKQDVVELDTFQSVFNNINGSASMRNSMFGKIPTFIECEIERLAMKQGHAASEIIEAARNGKFISEKQAYVVAYFAKSNGLVK